MENYYSIDLALIDRIEESKIENKVKVHFKDDLVLNMYTDAMPKLHATASFVGLYLATMDKLVIIASEENINGKQVECDLVYDTELLQRIPWWAIRKLTFHESGRGVEHIVKVELKDKVTNKANYIINLGDGIFEEECEEFMSYLNRDLSLKGDLKDQIDGFFVMTLEDVSREVAEHDKLPEVMYVRKETKTKIKLIKSV